MAVTYDLMYISFSKISHEAIALPQKISLPFRWLRVAASMLAVPVLSVLECARTYMVKHVEGTGTPLKIQRVQS